MKKQILLATSAALICGSAWASKARMQALGQDTTRGSFYLNDSRNVFRNAAGVAGMNNYAITEWGTAAASNDSAAAPSAEGGFFRSAGSFAYGVYLGGDVDSQNGLRNGGAAYAGSGLAMGNAGLLSRDNELDLFIAGDMGVEWGARLSYSKSKAEATTAAGKEATHSAFGIGLGAIMGDINAYANLQLSDKSEGTSASSDVKWEGTTGINIGAAYGMNDWNFFVDYDSMGGEYTAATGTAKNESTRKGITLGAANVKRISSSSQVIFDIRYATIKSEDTDGTTADNNVETTNSQLPLMVAFETDATSWLTLRGSITQPVLINSLKTKTSGASGREYSTTIANNTNVEAGMTLNFGKLKVDGSIGNTGLNGATAGSEVGVLSLDRLATRVGVHYWF